MTDLKKVSGVYLKNYPNFTDDIIVYGGAY